MPSWRPSRIARLPCTAMVTMPTKAISEPTNCHGPSGSRNTIPATINVMIGETEKMMPQLIALVNASEL